jgi:hypothetical protein
MTISSAKFILFFEKVWLFQIKAVPLRHENPPSLFTMLKSAGRFFIMEYTKHPITLADFSIDKNSINVLLTSHCFTSLTRTASCAVAIINGCLYPFPFVEFFLFDIICAYCALVHQHIIFRCMDE